MHIIFPRKEKSFLVKDTLFLKKLLTKAAFGDKIGCTMPKWVSYALLSILPSLIARAARGRIKF